MLTHASFQIFIFEVMSVLRNKMTYHILLFPIQPIVRSLPFSNFQILKFSNY